MSENMYTHKMKQQFIVANFTESRKVSAPGPDVERIIARALRGSGLHN